MRKENPAALSTGSGSSAVKVKVSGWPRTPVDGPVTPVVGGVSAFTCCIRSGDVLLVKRVGESVVYRAATVWVPTLNPFVVKLALPVPPTGTVVKSLPSMLKTTDPEGIATLGAALIKAVNGTKSPKMLGLFELEISVVVGATLTCWVVVSLLPV